MPRGSDLGDPGASPERLDALSWPRPASGSADPGLLDAAVRERAWPMVRRSAGRERPSGPPQGEAPLRDRASDLTVAAVPIVPRTSEPPVVRGEASRGPLVPSPAPWPPAHTSGPWDAAPSNDTTPTSARLRTLAKPAAADIGQLADRVYTLLVNRLADERRRRGI